MAESVLRQDHLVLVLSEAGVVETRRCMAHCRTIASVHRLDSWDCRKIYLVRSGCA
jgi:hypothetical protein